MPQWVRKLVGYGSEEHHQIYWAWRVYPLAMIRTLGLGYMVGSLITAVLFLGLGLVL